MSLPFCCLRDGSRSNVSPTIAHARSWSVPFALARTRPFSSRVRELFRAQRGIRDPRKRGLRPPRALRWDPRDRGFRPSLAFRTPQPDTSGAPRSCDGTPNP